MLVQLEEVENAFYRKRRAPPRSRFFVPSRKEVSLLCAFLDVIAKIGHFRNIKYSAW